MTSVSDAFANRMIPTVGLCKKVIEKEKITNKPRKKANKSKPWRTYMSSKNHPFLWREAPLSHVSHPCKWHELPLLPALDPLLHPPRVLPRLLRASGPIMKNNKEIGPSFGVEEEVGKKQDIENTGRWKTAHWLPVVGQSLTGPETVGSEHLDRPSYL